jgi:hypothetical protein
MAKVIDSMRHFAGLVGLLAIVTTQATTQASAHDGGSSIYMKGSSPNTVQFQPTGGRPLGPYGYSGKSAPPPYVPGPQRHFYDPNATPSGTMTNNAAKNGVSKKGP